MATTEDFQPNENKRRQRRSSDARKFMEPVRASIRESFNNTGNTELVAEYFEATPRSVSDVVKAGFSETLQGHQMRLAAIEARLGMGKATTVTGRLAIMQRRSA
jgi:hypothetical protein